MVSRTPPRPPIVRRAFAPGHLTGFFAPAERGRDPRARGSIGAGLVLDVGVIATARWTPGRRRGLSLTSDLTLPLPISLEVARRLVARAPGRLSVHLEHELPVGQGFGMSAAGALATALAVAAVVGRPTSKAIEVAHLAELFGGGGLGGVAAILGGGLERRIVPGVPPFGTVEHQPFRHPVLVSVVDAPLPSPTLLRSARFLERVRAAAESTLPLLREPLSEERFLDAAEAFTDAIGIEGPRLRRTIGRLRGSGAWVAQGMFGGSLFAVPPTPKAEERLLRRLADLRLHGFRLETSRHGARLLGTRDWRGSTLQAERHGRSVERLRQAF
jgi:pantoate kinase